MNQRLTPMARAGNNIFRVKRTIFVMTGCEADNPGFENLGWATEVVVFFIGHFLLLKNKIKGNHGHQKTDD
jgi:hypothetical protein